jgi:hypothetical protein
MNTPLVLLVALGIQTGFAADKDKTDPKPAPENPFTVPERFVPDANSKVRQAIGSSPWSATGPFDETTWAKNKVPVSTEADWSELGNGPGTGAGSSGLMAHAGVGDTFPVQDKDGHTLGEVFIAGGDDTQLQVEVRSKEGLQKLQVRRDKAVSFQMAGSKIELLFPTVSVNAAEFKNPTTNKAFLIMTRRP